VSNFEELGVKVGSSFIGYKCPLQTCGQDDGFAELETYVAIGVGNGWF
jgi:hypothetical protein